MRGEDLDPEVLADLRLRDNSMFDRTRSRGRDVYTWSPPAIVGFWGCRRPTCEGAVNVTQDALDYASQCDGWLISRGEQPLERYKISYCDRCLVEYKRTAPDRRRKQVDAMAVKIRELKESNDPFGERDKIDELVKMGHPDVNGLVQVLQERRANERASSSRKKGF
jgi:hypothetical protein